MPSSQQGQGVITYEEFQFRQLQNKQKVPILIATGKTKIGARELEKLKFFTMALTKLTTLIGDFEKVSGLPVLLLHNQTVEVIMTPKR